MTESIIKNSPQPQVVVQMKEEQCTWRVEIAKLMKNIGQDDLALEHMQAVLQEVTNITFANVEKEKFESDVNELISELKERISIRDSIG